MIISSKISEIYWFTFTSWRWNLLKDIYTYVQPVIPILSRIVLSSTSAS